MAGPNTTRQIGTACRIYKNSANKVIAVDAISIVGESRRINLERWHISGYPEHHRTLFHLGEGDRVVAKILMFGDYSSITEDSGDYLSATWLYEPGVDPTVISFNHLLKVGDTT